jgi:cytochrome P450
MAAIKSRHYLLDQTRRRFTPTLNNIPGMRIIQKRLLAHEWKQKVLAQPPAGSGLKPVLGDSGLPFVAHAIELLAAGPDYALHLYQTRGPLIFNDPVLLPGVVAVGPDAAQAVLSNRNKDFSSENGWHSLIGAFFNRGLMLLDFDEHIYHRRIMHEAFTRSRLASYVEHIDRVVGAVVADWPANDARFLFHPAIKKLTLDIASMVFMGHEPGTDHDLVTKVNKAFTQTVPAGGAILRFTEAYSKSWAKNMRERMATKAVLNVARGLR